jgi:hypothetical protein
MCPDAAQRQGMQRRPILHAGTGTPVSAETQWRARAEQARRIALMLSAGDAKALEAYAAECDAAAAALAETQVPIAAE